MYGENAHCVLQVVAVMSVSAKQTFLSRNNNIDKLRMKLYDIACHLQVASDGVTRETFTACTEPFMIHVYTQWNLL